MSPLSVGFALALSAAISAHAPTAADFAPAMPAGQTVEGYVREYFADMPVMIAIAECESRFRQFDSKGNVLKNEKGSSATGVMQIMASIHAKDAEKLGLDINTLEGNLGYARHLYEKKGTKPWQADPASKNCWEPKSKNLALAK